MIRTTPPVLIVDSILFLCSEHRVSRELLLVVAHAVHDRRHFARLQQQRLCVGSHAGARGANGCRVGNPHPTRDHRRAPHASHTALHEAHLRLQELATGTVTYSYSTMKIASLKRN